MSEDTDQQQPDIATGPMWLNCQTHGWVSAYRNEANTGWRCAECWYDERQRSARPAVKHSPGPVYASRSSLVAALKFSKPPHRNCSCWVCDLARVGQWHEHEAESRIGYGGECCAAMGRGLWALDSGGRTTSDRGVVPECSRIGMCFIPDGGWCGFCGRSK